MAFLKTIETFSDEILKVYLIVRRNLFLRSPRKWGGKRHKARSDNYLFCKSAVLDLIDDDGLFKLHIIAYKMKYNVFTINKIIYYNCS